MIFHFFRYGYFTAICTWIKFYKLNGIIKIKKILERNQSMGSVSKGKWYKLLIEKMDESIKSRYFFESIFIEYMIIDDRVKSLSNMAGIDLRDEKGKPKMLGRLIDELIDVVKVNPLPRQELLDNGISLASAEFIKEIKKEKYPLEKIDACFQSPRTIIYSEKNRKGQYYSKYGNKDTSLLIQLKNWADRRNHWMHAAGDDNLSLDEYETDIIELAIDGDVFVRELCAITMKIKRKNKS